MTPLRICELFAGIGATAQGLRDLGIPFESTVCEIDSKAYRAYCAIHGDTPNLGDITKVDRLPEADLVTWSFPCQDLSGASSRPKGMVEGTETRSSLCWEVIRLLRSAKAAGEPLPPVLLMENVPAILHKRNLPEFERLVSVLSGIGYESSYRILNACDYGVPQSRKRCFMVSVLRSHGGLGSFQWPEPCPDGRVLKDVLEPPEDVPERYYLSESRLEGLTRSTAKQRSKGNGFAFRPKGADDIAFSVTTQAGSRKTDNFVCVQTATLGGKGHECIRRIYSPTGLSPTVVTASGGGHIPKVELQDRSEVRYRKLSPLECLRLQGFPDDAFRAIRGLGLSDTDLYRLAGNSIAVPCLTAIYRSLRDAGLLRRRRPRDPWASKEVIYQQPIRKIMGIFRETHSTEQNTTRSEEEMAYWTFIYAQADGPACYLGTLRTCSGRDTDLLDMLGLDGEGICDLVRRKGWDGFDRDAVHIVEGDPDGLEQGDGIPTYRVVLDTTEGPRCIEVPDVGESLWSDIALYDEIHGTDILDDYDEKHVVIDESGLYRCPPYDGEPQHADDDEEGARCTAAITSRPRLSRRRTPSSVERAPIRRRRWHSPTSFWTSHCTSGSLWRPSTKPSRRTRTTWREASSVSRWGSASCTRRSTGSSASASSPDGQAPREPIPGSRAPARGPLRGNVCAHPVRALGGAPAGAAEASVPVQGRVSPGSRGLLSDILLGISIHPSSRRIHPADTPGISRLRGFR